MHPEPGATDGKQQAAPGYYNAGKFDDKIMEELHEQFRSRESTSSLVNSLDVVSSSSILMVCLCVMFAMVSLTREETYLPKGDRDNISRIRK